MNKCIKEGSILIIASFILVWLMLSLLFEPLLIMIKIFVTILLIMIIMGTFFVGLFELLEGIDKWRNK